MKEREKCKKLTSTATLTHMTSSLRDIYFDTPSGNQTKL